MRETHYIDIDEEIISAVGRLRRSSQLENIFIFPKRALILQSIVNLRLLEREAKKLGKKIIITTQDEAGRKLAERAGLIIEAYSDQMAFSSNRVTSTMAKNSDELSLLSQSEQQENSLLQRASSTDLGSAEFYPSISRQESGDTLQPVLQEENIVPTPRPIRVRNASPTPLTTLNSVRSDGVRPPIQSSRVNPAPQARSSALYQKTILTQQQQTAGFVDQSEPQQGRLQRFMRENLASSNGKRNIPAQRGTSSQITPPVQQRHVSRAGRGWMILLGSVVCISIIGLIGWYVLFPNVVVTLEPQAAEQMAKIQLSAAASGDAATITARVIGNEKTFQIKGEATGTTTSGDASKARGTIRIYNDFSSESQTLVATTRFETTDGKIYRLLQTVVVPGVTEKNGKRERGTIDATVIADQTGDDYNISPARFTIPGFKNGPKYEKFSAESLQKFSGGGSSVGNTQKIISAEDKDRITQKALEDFRSHVLTEMKRELRENEVLLEESLWIEKINETIVPAVGSAATDFTYEGRYRIQVFALNELEVKKRIEAERVNASGVVLTPKRYTVSYASLLPKYDMGKIDFTVESTIQFEANIDTGAIRQGLLGQDEEGIRAFLKLHPEIERLQVEFTPQLIIATIPNNPERVEVKLQTSGGSGD